MEYIILPVFHVISTNFSVYQKIPQSQKFCLTFLSLVVHLVELSIEKVRVAFFFHWNRL